jgi:hypothetical protein
VSAGWGKTADFNKLSPQSTVLGSCFTWRIARACGLRSMATSHVPQGVISLVAAVVVVIVVIVATCMMVEQLQVGLGAALVQQLVGEMMGQRAQLQRRECNI